MLTESQLRTTINCLGQLTGYLQRIAEAAKPTQPTKIAQPIVARICGYLSGAKEPISVVELYHRYNHVHGKTAIRKAVNALVQRGTLKLTRRAHGQYFVELASKAQKVHVQ